MLFFNEETKTDFTPFFKVYLKQISPPVVEFHLDKSNSDTTIIEYKWALKLPEDFKMKVNFVVGKQVNVIYPTSTIQQLKFLAKEVNGFDLINTGYFLLKERK
jgi:hypothetical protein